MGVAKHRDHKGGAKQTRATRRTTEKLVKKNILKRYPARTVYRTQSTQAGTFKLLKKPSAASRRVSKRPSSNVSKRPAANLKNAGRWLWIGVVVGRRGEVCTHPDGTKQITYRFLPRKVDAQAGKPRGLEEIRDTLQARVRKGSFLVFDGWTATKAAVQDLGYRFAPPVVHEEGYRDVATGFHTNDVESENSRLKGWNRKRYGRLVLDEFEMQEYVFRVNVGHTMAAIMSGLAAANGGRNLNEFI